MTPTTTVEEQHDQGLKTLHLFGFFPHFERVRKNVWREIHSGVKFTEEEINRMSFYEMKAKMDSKKCRSRKLRG